MPEETNPLWKDTAQESLVPVRGITPEVLPPQRFNLSAIERDLESLGTSRSLIRQYITAAKARYRTRKQTELLDLLVELLQQKTAVLQAQTALATAEEEQADFVRLRHLRENLSEANLQADLAEAKLRRVRAERDIANGGQEQKSQDQQKMEAALDRLRNQIRFQLEKQLGARILTEVEIDNLRRKYRAMVLDVKGATADEKEKYLDLIDKLCHQKRGESKQQRHIDIYTEEE